jgi:hypothetical protein
MKTSFASVLQGRPAPAWASVPSEFILPSGSTGTATGRWSSTSLSWQINYAGLPELMTGPKAGKVMAAMMGMTKIDIQALQDAAA